MKEIKKLAFEILAEIDKKQNAYNKINAEIRKIQPDFATHIQLTDPYLEEKIILLLDKILGAEIASYFLYECKSMRNGGLIKDGNKEFKIKSITDVKKYLDFLEK